MKSTVVGSKFTEFDRESQMCNNMLPNKILQSKMRDSKSDRYIPVSILQIEAVPYNNTIRYIVEYIEKDGDK